METITVSGNTMSQEPMSMGRRALLTESEREAIQNPESKDNPYVAVSRIRTKIEDELPEDVEILRENRPDLLEELQEVVCADVDQESHSSPQSDDVQEREPTTPREPEGPSDRERAEKRLHELDLTGSGTNYELRVEAALRMYDHLQDNPGERIDKGELKDLLEGTDVGYASFESFWGNWIKKNESQGRPSNTLSELPNVEMRGDDYVYTGVNNGN